MRNSLFRNSAGSQAELGNQQKPGSCDRLARKNFPEQQTPILFKGLNGVGIVMPTLLTTVPEQPGAKAL